MTETLSPAAKPGYDRQEVNPLRIVLAGVTIIALIAGFIIALDQLFISTREAIVQEVVLSRPSTPLREINARDAEILNSYAIIDKEKGVVRIPIGRAMELMVQQAYPSR